MSEELFRQITTTVRAYGATLSPNPVMTVKYTVSPDTTDIGADTWHVAALLECFGEITDGEPKPLDSVLWESTRETLDQCLEEILGQVQARLRRRAVEMQLCLSQIVPLLPIVEEPEPEGRVVSVSAVLHPAR